MELIEGQTQQIENFLDFIEEIEMDEVEDQRVSFDLKKRLDCQPRANYIWVLTIESNKDGWYFIINV